MSRVLREHQYRCRLCEHSCDKRYNSYLLKLSDKIHIMVCRHCYLRIEKYNSLLKKVKLEDIE